MVNYQRHIWESDSEYYNRIREEERRQYPPPIMQGQAQAQPNFQMPSMGFGGKQGGIPGFGSSGQGASAGGTSGLGTAGIIGAAILAQHLMSRGTDTEYEGVKTDDAFAGHFMTEPWLGFAYDKLGFSPSVGEKFDAAIENKDWGTALKRAPSAMNYWANPGGTVGYDVVSEVGGKIPAMAFDPLQWLLRRIGG